MNPRQRTLLAVIALAAAALLGWFRQREAPPARAEGPRPGSGTSDPVRSESPREPSGSRRDLAADEERGGHTLARHVGKSDAELDARLRLERKISAASTWSDRETAERVVGSALANGSERLARWLERPSPRPNLVLGARSDDDKPIGRSLRRGERRPRDCSAAKVVLKDAGDSDWFVLTAYPEVSP
jgi:hypothetical protein